IIDYKTNLAPNPAQTERHLRQLRLYSFLWFDNYGYWPTEGLLVYVNLGREVVMAIDPAECIEIAEQAKKQAHALPLSSTPPESLANPGPSCVHCDYRPWCQPFW